MTRTLFTPLLLSMALVACDGSGVLGGRDTGDGDGSVLIDPITGKPISGSTGDSDTSADTDSMPGSSTGSTGHDPGEPDEPLADCDTPGPRMIRRLTDLQYKNTLKELLGPDFPAEDVLTDPAVNGFHVDADAALVTDLTAELLMNYSERAAAWAMDNQRWRLANCNNHEASCHEQVVREFGRRAFRMDLSDEQIQPYLQLFAAEETFDAGLHVVISTMLQSPYLLYRRELGEPDAQAPGLVRLTPYEIASELSYMLTDAPPNESLMRRVSEGRLSTQDDIDQAASELLSSEQAKQGLAHFVQGWLEIDNLDIKAKDPSVFDLSLSLRQAMVDETSQFFISLFESGGTIGDLYGANHTMLNEPLSQFYGLSVSSGDSFSRVELSGQRPTGILGHASFLTQHALPENSSPVQRGLIVRERLLCQDLPPVPANLDTNLSDPAEFSTNRERYRVHSEDAVCKECHDRIDPVGFAFEEYDAFGRYRSMENGLPIDATGELDDVVGGPIPLDGVQSLSDYLAGSDEARSCFIRYWSYYAHGRAEWEQYECNHDGIRAEVAEQGDSLRDTLLAIVHAPHFTHRVAD